MNQSTPQHLKIGIFLPAFEYMMDGRRLAGRTSSRWSGARRILASTRHGYLSIQSFIMINRMHGPATGMVVHGSAGHSSPHLPQRQRGSSSVRS